MATLESAVDLLVSTYQDLDVIARGLVVDPQEIADALAIADSDSAEAIVLRMLQKYNPITNSVVLSE